MTEQTQKKLEKNHRKYEIKIDENGKSEVIYIKNETIQDIFAEPTETKQSYDFSKMYDCFMYHPEQKSKSKDTKNITKKEPQKYDYSKMYDCFLYHEPEGKQR